MQDFMICGEFEEEENEVRRDISQIYEGNGEEEESKEEVRNKDTSIIEEELDFKQYDANQILYFLENYNSSVNNMMKKEEKAKIQIPEERAFGGMKRAESREANRELDPLDPETDNESVSIETGTFIVKSVPNYFMDEILSYKEPSIQYSVPLIESLKSTLKNPKEIQACARFLKKNPPIDFLRLYTCESPFYKNLNYCLAHQNYEAYKDILTTFLFYEKHLSPNIPSNTLYRGITLTEELLRKFYKEGRTYYWSSFSSTSVNEEIAHSFMLLHSNRGIGTLFKIIVDLNTKWNKYNMKNYSYYEEEEVLLLPYFKFEVRKKILFFDPHTGQKRAIILLKEIPTHFYGRGDSIFQTLEWKLGVIWTDPEVMKPKNAQYRANLTTVLAQNNINIEFITSKGDTKYICNKEKDIVFVLISNGFGATEFVQEISLFTSVIKMCIFTSGNRLEEWKQWEASIPKINCLTDNFIDVSKFIENLIKELEGEKWFKKQRAKPKTMMQLILETLRQTNITDEAKSGMIKRMIQTKTGLISLDFSGCINIFIYIYIYIIRLYK